MSEIDLMVIKIYLKVNRVMSEMFVQEIVHFFFFLQYFTISVLTYQIVQLRLIL